MNYFIKNLTKIGLILSLFGAIILIYPNLTSTRNVNDDFIISMDRVTGDFTQVKHEREKLINIWGLSLLATGFILQFAGTIRKN